MLEGSKRVTKRDKNSKYEELNRENDNDVRYREYFV